MLAITDIRLPSTCRQTLVSKGFSVLHLPPFPLLDLRVASHPDMLILPFNDRLFVHRDYYRIAKKEIDEIVLKTSLSLVLTDDAIDKEYPNDISLNVSIIGKYILGRKNAISSAVLEYAENNGYQIVDIKQGYAKCSTLILGDRAIITADPSIEKAGQALSLDVLRISEGNVLLDGYDHGFIGGASGVFDNTAVFCGNIRLHPDGGEILSFCHKHGFDVLSLSESSLEDVGTMFFL